MSRKLQGRPRRLGRVSVALLLCGVALPARAETSSASTTTTDTPVAPAPENQQEIVVVAPPWFRDVTPERSLDEDSIEGYGVSTIDELLGEVQGELGDDLDPPLLIVNGQRVNDISDIGGLPVEALRNVQVLPRGSALKAGGTATQRVISLTLKRIVRSATVTAAHKLATDGGWNADRGELIGTSVKGDTRANLTLRVRDESSLLESDRDIIQPPPRLPYALGGNIIGFPNTSGEIDPLLSALAGELVTIVPFPSSAATLADLAGVANTQNSTDLGRFRTLRPDTRNYDLNGTFAKRLAPWLTANATLRWGWNNSRSLRGLPSQLFVLAPTNALSPFGTDVGIAEYGPVPLQSRSRHSGGGGTLTFNADWGRWQGNLNLVTNLSRDHSFIDRQTSFGSIPIPDGVDPFTADLTKLITIGVGETSIRSTTSLADLTVNGTAATLPGGDVSTTVEAQLGWNKLVSDSSFSSFNNGTFRRNQQSIRGAVEVPIASAANHFIPEVGELSASVEYSRAHFSDAGTVSDHTYGLTWEPRPPLRLHAAIRRTSAPAPIQTIGSPVIITPGVRVFDALTGQTVDVTEILGGNPFLLPEETKVRNLSALLRLIPKYKLQLSAEYTDTEYRNYVAGLPEASAAVMLAFPDRFVRDASGVLTTVDLRPVNFESHHEKRLRWGLSMNMKLGGGAVVVPPGGKRAIRGRTTSLQLTVNHSMVFSDRIFIRPGLDPVDLLSGGAIGIGGGRVRHQLDGTASLNSGGLGVRMGVLWRGPSELTSRINGVTDNLRFSSLLVVNLRAFADAKRFLPHDSWARGFRVSLDVINATNKRQTVRNSLGDTPLQYQPGYRDRLGRTIELEIRKIF